MGVTLRDLSGEECPEPPFPVTPYRRPNDPCLSARCRPGRCYRLRAHECSEVSLHLLDPNLGLRDPPLWSRGLQGLPEYATQAVALLFRQGAGRRALQRLRGVLHSVSRIDSRLWQCLMPLVGCSPPTSRTWFYFS